MSNKLDNVTKRLDLEGKIEHEGFGLWAGVMEGDASAQRKMQKYNIRDVTLLEDLYEILRPWIRNHPSVPLHDSTNTDGCPKCGSTGATRRGYAYTTVSKFARFQCNDCRGYYQSTKAVSRVSTKSVA